MDIIPLLQKKTSKKEVQVYLHEALPKITLSDLGREYCQLSKDCRTRIINHMSGELLLLHRVVLWLPKDVQKCVIKYMFEGDEAAVKMFRKDKPMLEAFQLYQTIKKNIGKNKRIAPLYKMSQEKRDDVFDKLNPWYSFYMNPILSIEEQQAIYSLGEDEQQYFRNREVRVVSESRKEQCMEGVIGLGSGFLGLVVGDIIGLVFCCMGDIHTGWVACAAAHGSGCLVGSACYCFGVGLLQSDESNKVKL